MYDLALRIVAKWYYYDLKSMKKVAERMNIGIGTVWRWLKQDVIVKKRVYQPIKLSDSILTFLRALLDEESTLTQIEMSDRLRKAFGIYFSRKCISIALSKIGYTRKKLSKRGLTDAYKKRAKTIAFRDEYFSSEQCIIAVDEVGFDFRTVPMKGYSRRGKKCISPCLIKQRKRLSVIMAIDRKGMHHFMPFMSRVNGTCFTSFVKSLPWTNCKVILDNASIHKTADVYKAFQEGNLSPLFIPASTPECNPIENVFSVIKSKFSRVNHLKRKAYYNHLKHDKQARYVEHEMSSSMWGTANDAIAGSGGFKNSNTQTWLQALGAYGQHVDIIKMFQLESKDQAFRKMKSLRRKKAFFDQRLKSIIRPDKSFQGNVILGTGNEDFASTGRGERAVPTVGLAKTLRRVIKMLEMTRRVRVVLIPEFNTTKCCHCCGKVMHTLTTSHGSDCLRYRLCINCNNETIDKRRNRDVNAAKNILKLLQCVIKGLDRPTALKIPEWYWKDKTHTWVTPIC